MPPSGAAEPPTGDDATLTGFGNADHFRRHPTEEQNAALRQAVGIGARAIESAPDELGRLRVRPRHPRRGDEIAAGDGPGVDMEAVIRPASHPAHEAVREARAHVGPLGFDRILVRRRLRELECRFGPCVLGDDAVGIGDTAGSDAQRNAEWGRSEQCDLDRLTRQRRYAPARVAAVRRPIRPAKPRVDQERLRLRGYFSGFVPAIQMITLLNRPSASMSKKLQLCMSFFVPSRSSPI
jgi:hypothetical protein